MSHPRILALLLLLIGPAALLAGCGGGGGNSGGGGGGGSQTVTGYNGIAPLSSGQTAQLVLPNSTGPTLTGTLTLSSAAGTGAPAAGAYTVSGALSSGRYTLTGIVSNGTVTVSGTLPGSGGTPGTEGPFTVSVGGTTYTGSLLAALSPGSGSTGTVSGKVVDLTGSPVPSATLLLDGVQQNFQPASGSSSYLAGGNSFGEGGYQLRGVPAGIHVLSAWSVNGYTGSTQVYVGSGYATDSANIVVSPPSQQVIVLGTVTNSGTLPLAGAQVSLRFPVAVTQSNPTGYASLTGYTFASPFTGEFQLYNVPTRNADGTPRVYTANAGYQVPDPQASSPVYDNATAQTNLTFTAGTNPTLPAFAVPVHSGTYAALTPTLNLVQAITEPDAPPDVNARARPAAGSATATTANSIYTQILRHLSPTYASLSANGRAAARVVRQAAAAHATSENYRVETDLFFSLPGDTATQADPNRSQIYGFDIRNDVGAPLGRVQPYAFLQDPLASFFDDPDLGINQSYIAGTPFNFQVESDAASNTAQSGLTPLGDSNIVAVTPLSFLNLLHPGDPVDNNDVAERFTSDTPTFQWQTLNPTTNTADTRVASYTVFLYNAFPGVNTGSAESLAGINPNYAATYTVPTTSSSSQTFTLPTALTTGEHWVVIAATATDNTAQSQAVTVSQITPFFVP